MEVITENKNKIKRKGYKTIEAQIEANKRYYNSSDEAKLKRKKANYKSNTKTFIKELATKEELQEIEKLIQENLKKF